MMQEEYSISCLQDLRGSRMTLVRNKILAQDEPWPESEGKFLQEQNCWKPSNTILQLAVLQFDMLYS